MRLSSGTSFEKFDPGGNKKVPAAQPRQLSNPKVCSCSLHLGKMIRKPKRAESKGQLGVFFQGIPCFLGFKGKPQGRPTILWVYQKTHSQKNGLVATKLTQKMVWFQPNRLRKGHIFGGRKLRGFLCFFRPRRLSSGLPTLTSRSEPTQTRNSGCLRHGAPLNRNSDGHGIKNPNRLAPSEHPIQSNH